MESAMHSLKIKLVIIDCVTTLFLKFIMERHAQYRAITIVKSSVAGYVVQPFTVTEGGIEAVKDESPRADSEDFTLHDDLLSSFAMAAVPTIDPACTLRSTQQSNAEDPDKTQLMEDSDESQSLQPDATADTSFDLVSDSNSEEDSSFWDVTEE
ncbi:hypothetical protein PHMEG_00041694, partial [Phytophthora megakarya]